MTSLNESQQRTILFGFLDIHRRMAEMEAFIAQSAEASSFSQYVNDLSPTESKVVRDYFARIRSTLLACSTESGIPLEVRRTSLRWALQCGMTFLHIAVAEMSPDRMRGYGSLTDAGREQVVKVQQDLTRLIERVAAYLRQGLGQNLSQRLIRLEAAPASVQTLTLLDRIITHWQLVEFRPQFDTIVRRLESPRFEIAVFGRVSSGKSSLLNHLAGTDVLPVGVTPITAVPTRLVRGEPAAAIISFAEVEARAVPPEELREYASEEGNPGNYKHVTDILVRLPSPRLREGVVFVDTPGVGSFALTGSAETFAYLPRCDLGVALIDAAATPTQDDLSVLRLLAEAGIPAQVLLSKADLLTSADRQRMNDYIRGLISRELNLDLPVHPVSTIGADEVLLERWFEQEIGPLLDRHRGLVEASLRRKIAHMRESVLAVLQTLQARNQGGVRNGDAPGNLNELCRLLDETDAAVRQAEARAWDWTRDEDALLGIILHDAAWEVATPNSASVADDNGPVPRVLQQVLVQRGRMAHELLTQLQQTLAHTLEALRPTSALANADPAAVRDLAFSGMPVVDVATLRGVCRWSRPWWASLFPALAMRVTRRALARCLGQSLREQVVLYDRQLRSWLKGCLERLVDVYESQAGVFREQVRRLSADGEAHAPMGDAAALTDDLRELQQATSAEVEGEADSEAVRQPVPG